METAIAEVKFHKSRFLENAHITGEHTFDYVDFLADFSGMFHQLGAAECEACLEPGPIPRVLRSIPGFGSQTPV